MALLTIDDVTIGFAGPHLLDEVSAQIEPGQRIGLLGRNGAGKTTLLKMLAGELQPDHGAILVGERTRVQRLTQDVPGDMGGLIHDVVQGGLPADWVADPSTAWQAEHAVEVTLSRMQLDAQVEFASLSSGMKRRVLLARAIVSKPDILLLDEPTNHLDIESILWLENFLSRWENTLVFITHDRSFLRKLATRIWEIDRGRLFDWSCDYETFLVRKERALEAEDKQNALFDKRLAEEESWIRQGIKARRTRNEGRVRALKSMRRERQQRQDKVGTARLQLQQAARSGMLVAELEDVSFAYDDRRVIDRLSTLLMRGDKVGIIGPNGAGKSTLLKLLLGKLQPDSGKIRLGTNLKIAYFDQLRDTLDPEQTVQENVGEGSEQLNIQGKAKHVLGYLQDYLFTPERARTKVKFLSGGERNRALLAKLMTKPANVLVLDEPTNDLDAETLELLEEMLVQFDGTVLLVSHDRTFLNNVVTSTIVFENDGIGQYVGGYDEWQAVIARRQLGQSEHSTDKASDKTNDKPPGSKAPAQKPTPQPTNTAASPVEKRKLSFNEQRELQQLPQRIETLEKQIADLHAAMADPSYYQKPGDVIATDATRLAELEAELGEAYERWEHLEE